MSLLQSPPSLIHLINAHMSVRTCSQLYIFTSSRLPPNAHMILYARSTHFFPAALARFPAPFKRHVINPTTYICSTWKPTCTNVRTHFSSYFLLLRTNGYVIPYAPFGNICKFVFTIWSILFVSNVHILYIFLDFAFGS